MTLKSSLADFSLAELLRMMEQGRKSGRLTLCMAGDATQYHIWLKQGKVVATAARLDGQNLTQRIVERGWLSQRVIEKLGDLSATQGIPLGLALKTQGILQAEQLHLLFSAQIQMLLKLFDNHTGHFELDGKATPPTSEMTGLSLPAIEVALGGMRYLKNWNALADALPDPTFGIKSTVPGKPQLRLNALEWQVWEFAQGTIAIREIAQQLNQSVEKIQQAVFRLMLIGLVEEVPLVTAATEIPDTLPPLPLASPVAGASMNETDKSKPSASFLQNLVGFLRSKA
jgi:hypothetical protein